MAVDRVLKPLTESDLDRLRGAFKTPDPREAPDLLTVSLSSTADSIRHLHATFGTHIYRVFLHHQIWTGNLRGVGALQSLSRREILPAPRVRDMSVMSRILRSTGITEEGDVTVDRISISFSEDDLIGKTPDLTDPQLPVTSRSAIEFSWEIQESRPQTPNTLVRRFKPSGVPDRRQVQWSISLVKADGDAKRDGSTERNLDRATQP